MAGPKLPVITRINIAENVKDPIIRPTCELVPPFLAMNTGNVGINMSKTINSNKLDKAKMIKSLFHNFASLHY